GYIGTKTTLRPDLGFQLSPQAYIMTALLLFVGFFNRQQSVQLAHLAHVGGLVAGIAVGFVLSDRRFDSR
ncbi:MAG: rhomboid family intramembrane serine protease, partial [Pirellula sp.]